MDRILHESGPISILFILFILSNLEMHRSGLQLQPEGVVPDPPI